MSPSNDRIPEDTDAQVAAVAIRARRRREPRHISPRLRIAAEQLDCGLLPELRRLTCEPADRAGALQRSTRVSTRLAGQEVPDAREASRSTC